MRGLVGLSIRKHTYRDKEGYLISGKNPRGQHLSIFATSLKSAMHIKAKALRGEDINSVDFAE
jgi:hypothetical protein